MPSTPSHRRHRRPVRRAGSPSAGRRRFLVLLLPVALLAAVVGFGLDQFLLASTEASADGASTVSAGRPDVGTITATAPDPTRVFTLPSAGATGPAAAKNATGLTAVTVPTVPLTPIGPAPAAPSSGPTAAAPRAAAPPAALTGAASGDPFTSATLYVDPNGDAAKAVATLSASDPAGAQTLQRLAGRSHADWFGDPVPATVGGPGGPPGRGGGGAPAR
ncbi:hypothetical protein MXD60_08100, partial [Frankia sp. AgB32]|nr:hypothetical protein [Frankia sp. AgB32]